MSKVIYEPHNVVWVKYKDYPHWPSRIATREDMIQCSPISTKRKDELCVYFFQTKACDWVKPSAIHDWYKYYEQYSKAKKIQRALEDANNYIKSFKNNSNHDSSAEESPLDTPIKVC